MKRKVKPHSETMWAIRGEWENHEPFFYLGTYLTRRDAIKSFCSDTAEINLTVAWKKEMANGIRVVKVRITEIAK